MSRQEEIREMVCSKCGCPIEGLGSLLAKVVNGKLIHTKCPVETAHSRQEEIREGIQAIIDGYDSTLPIDEPCPHCVVVDQILTYLDSRDVVIKVDGELPRHLKAMWCHSSKDMRFEEFAFEDSLRKAGLVATESLIGKVS